MLNAFRFRIFIVVLAVLFAAYAFAEQRTFDLDPAQTTVAFTLGDVLHTVHGTFHLKRGSIQFDDVTGQASGEMVVDALSGASGNQSRDKKMHKENLESSQYAEITFTPQHIKGSITADGGSQVDIDGLMALHGQSHPMTLTMHVNLAHGAGAADTTFSVPYEKWGVKNPSTFLLRVSNQVEINVHAVGRLSGAR